MFQSTDIYTQRNASQGGIKGRSFKILSDKTISLTRDANVTTLSRKIVNWSRTYKNPIRQFDYSNGYNKNLIYIMFVATSATTEMDWSYQISVNSSLDE